MLARHRAAKLPFPGWLEAWVNERKDERLYELNAPDATVVTSGLHWLNDLPAALSQHYQALKPGGLFLGMLPGPQTLIELRQAMLDAAATTGEGAAPRISPFVDVKDAGALLQRAGFHNPVADSEVLTVRYTNLFELFQDLRAAAETNSLLLRPRAPLKRNTLASWLEHYEKLRGEDGRLPATFEMVTLTGWKQV